MSEIRFVELDTITGDGKIETRLYNVAHVVFIYPNRLHEDRCCMWTLDCEDAGIDLDHPYVGVMKRLQPSLY